MSACPLCSGSGGELLWSNEKLRLIRAAEPDYPAFLRLVWNAHVAEMSDLAAADRAILLDVLLRVETALREVLRPDKINLASLGNLVPHLHWHLIPRWRDDRHFPDAVWAAPRRALIEADWGARRHAAAAPLEAGLARALAGL